MHRSGAFVSLWLAAGVVATIGCAQGPDVGAGDSTKSGDTVSSAGGARRYTVPFAPGWQFSEKDRLDVGFVRAARPGEAAGKVRFPVLLPSETLGRQLVRILYKPSTDPTIPRGTVHVLYSGRLSLLGDGAIPPDATAITKEHAALLQGGVLTEVQGVPVASAEATLMPGVWTAEPQRSPTLVRWIYDGAEWTLFADYDERVAARDLMRVAETIISLQKATK